MTTPTPQPAKVGWLARLKAWLLKRSCYKTVAEQRIKMINRLQFRVNVLGELAMDNERVIESQRRLLRKWVACVGEIVGYMNGIKGHSEEEIEAKQRELTGIMQSLVDLGNETKEYLDDQSDIAGSSDLL